MARLQRVGAGGKEGRYQVNLLQEEEHDSPGSGMKILVKRKNLARHKMTSYAQIRLMVPGWASKKLKQ